MTDAATRQIVRSQFDQNFCLSAGAGAGKTEELTRRAAHWLIYGAPAQFDRHQRQQGLVLLTFTEAGASEMGDRIERLLDRLSGDDGWEESTPGLEPIGREIELVSGLSRQSIQSLASELLDGPSVRVSTFHAFCLELLRDYGETIGLPARLELERSDAELARLRREVSWDVLSEEMASGKTGLFQKPIRTDWVVDVLCALSPSPWLPDDRLDELSNLLGYAASGAQMRELLGELRALEAGFSSLGKGAIRRTQAISAELAKAIPNWRELAEQLKKLAGLKAVEDDATRERMKSLAARASLRDRWHPAFWEQLLPHLPRLLRKLRAKQVYRRRIGFDDALRYAVELLSARPGVRRQLGREIQQMMVDEFQDTDPLQCELLRLLHQDESQRFVPGRLFIVGDDKQSIYGFRGADLDAFTAFCGELIENGATPLKLNRNFRSDQAVLDMVATGFHEAFGEAATMIPRDHAGPGDVQVFGWTKPKGNETVAERARLQSEVALLIKARLEADDAIKPSDCAILARSGAQVEDWCRILTAHGLPVTAVGRRNGLEHEAMHDLLCLLSVLSGQSDTATVFGLLQSPLLNWAPSELSTFLARGTLAALLEATELLPERRDQVQRLLTLRSLFEARRLSQLQAQLITGGWCPGPWAAAPQQAADLQRLASEFFEAAGDPEVDLTEWVELHRDAADYMQSASGSDGVVVMTLHGAKGLEWPWVIAASLPSRGGNNRRKPLSGHGQVLAIDVPNGPWVGPLLELQAAQEQRSEAEERRLAYVACTRAERELWLVGGVDNTGTPIDHLVSSLNAAGHVTQLSGADDPALPDETIGPYAPRVSESGDWMVAQPLSVSPSQIDALHDERHRQGDARDEADDDAIPQRRRIATAVGELVHLVLELIDFSRPLSEQILEVTERALAQMAEQLPSESLGPVFDESLAVLEHFAQSPLAQSLINSELVARELPFSCPAAWLDPTSKARMGTGFIDLIYRTASGELVVADWKVTREKNHAVLKERYRPQLEAYRRVVSRLCPDEPISMQLLLIRSGEVVRLE